MRRFSIVFERELKETVRSKSFIVISVVFGVLLAAIAVLSASLAFAPGQLSSMLDLTSDDGQKQWDYVVAVYDKTEKGDIAERLRDQLATYRFDTQVACDDELIESCLNDEYDAFLIINDPLDFECCEKTSIEGTPIASMIAAALERDYRTNRLAEEGVSYSDAVAILDSSASYVLRETGGYGIKNYFVNYMLTMIMYLVITLYGQMVATRVASEKSSRTMEVLATTVTPGELLCGKVIGVGTAGFLQLMAFLGAAVGMLVPAINKIPRMRALLADALDFPPADIAVLALYFVLGFLLIAFVYGGLGSMVSRVEDLSGIVSLPSYIFMIGYFISLMSAVGEPGPLIRISSFVPFWSPVVMISRMTMETVPAWQIALSLLILAATCALCAQLSTQLYRAGMLRYGKPPKIKELIGILRASTKRATTSNTDK